MKILTAAYEAWSAAASFRSNRDRYKRFTYGDQWSDIVMDGDRKVTMAERAIAHGRRPMTNNLLRRVIKSVIGRYRYNRQEKQILEDKLKRLYDSNNLDELDCRSLEEFLISGCTVQRGCHERTLHGTDAWVTAISPERFFVNSIKDPRGWDCELVGMLHDWSLTETIIRLAGPDKKRTRIITEAYSDANIRAVPIELGTEYNSLSFFTAAPGRCRVIEVWTLEAVQRFRCHDTERASFFTLPLSAEKRLKTLNASRRERGKGIVDFRWEAATQWRCRWYAPDGTILHSHLSNAPDGLHPFHFRFYPMIDGEIHSLVEDVIDQQIYINELISLIDHVVGCAAKGVLLFPSDEKLPSMSWEEIADRWSTPDGIIPIRGRSMRPPSQVTSSATNCGAKELLETQMKMFEDVSGVADVLMGRTQGGNIGAEHYENQVKNALIAIADILDTFDNFISCRNDRLPTL
ncbi:MAG: hypothetical protein K2G40_08300 [Muribaculaceae bacterium]|nr:hypothetical protein [Muribaculaceae bacterium]